MITKLTLTLDKDLIVAAKLYAKNSGTSLSKNVDQYLKNLIRENQIQDISPKLNKIIGAVKLPKKFKEKEEFHTYLEKKHSRI
ncbi:MAG: hypothetical protein B7Y69_03590 [Sphingobacteriia bacterium 35-40-8]|nr:MAG: hypothetical protein B7Y69_03590 [Sphingobacteriia bacterium 35-40-8]